ncbi:MAG: DNA methylase [Clostridia bacterium]|nr:DNA methylase [Clostridia bacterium]
MKEQYIAIDLKSFYASVECIERGLDPLTTNLVVADGARTEKTICLAVSPSLKSYGVPGRPRLFEVIAKIKEVNSLRRWSAPGRRLISATYDNRILLEDPRIAVDYIVAPPRMALYIDYSTRIYQVYLKYFSPDDIHVYSIDEVFIDATHYLKSYKKTARELAENVVRDVLNTTGITATVGIGTNMYLAKVAMDIVAKRMKPDEHGVRIAELDEMSYRRILWEHRPLTDFWRVGRGYAKKLEAHGIYTMGDVALTSVHNEWLLYKLFGINAELLIDHAWGWECCTIADIKAYRPSSKSLSSGQVLHSPYTVESARIILREMCDGLVLDMVDKGVAANQAVLTVGYDIESLTTPGIVYNGEITHDFYGRSVPKHAHGSVNFERHTSSTEEITNAVLTLYDKIINHALLIRRINISVNNLAGESKRNEEKGAVQLDFFTNYEEKQAKDQKSEESYAKEKQKQKAVIAIRKKFGGNAIIRGMSLEEGATAIDRNSQIGGHKA